MFNLGGGPGIRVHQMGGARPRRRPRDPNAPPEPPASLSNLLVGLLPILLILVLPLLGQIFSGPAEKVPGIRFDSAVPPHTMHRHSPRLKVDYFINPIDVKDWTPSQFHKLDGLAESKYVKRLNVECNQEEAERQELIEQAAGWFYQDEEKMKKARNMPMASCKRLDQLAGNR